MTTFADEPTTNSDQTQLAPERLTHYESILLPSKWMQAILKLRGLISLAFKRQVSHPSLTFLALLGIILAVGLVTSIAFFSQAVDQVVISQELGAFSDMTGRPPFSTRIYTFPSTRQPLTLQQAEDQAPHVAETMAKEVGLPLLHLGLEVDSGNLALMPGKDSVLYGDGKTSLSTVSATYVHGISAHMEIIGGDALDEGQSGDVLDVWMHTKMAEKIGTQIGESFEIGVNLRSNKIPIRIRGFWQAKDATDPFWFSDPDAKLDEVLLVRRNDYISRIQPLISARTRLVNWHIILDDEALIPSEARNYLKGFERSLAILQKFVPDARLNTPPLDPLETFVDREFTLTTLLLGFNIPAFGFLIYFLILTSVIIARWQRRENAILVSRGMSLTGILNLTFVEEMLLFVVGYPLGIAFGMALAWLMGYTDSFLTFTSREALPVSLQGMNIPLTIIALGIALLARLGPVLQDARHSVLDEERERARPIKGPFWYRFYLDLLMLIPTAYAYRQLADQGSLSELVDAETGELYSDPLLILVPALFVLTGALIGMRLFPFIMRLLDRLSIVTPWLSLHLALRQLGRQSQSYINPLLLVIISLALGVYTLSMAASLDQWLVDRMFYFAGADLTFEPAVNSGDDGVVVPPDGAWIPQPIQFAELPGVSTATRVGDFPARTTMAATGRVRGRFLGLDRLTFPDVAWFRYDFAREDLGSLMNRLALAPDAILVSQDFLEENHLNIGDQVSLLVSINVELGVDSPFTIVGTYDYFPTVYPDEQITFIGNLDYLSSFLGITVPHNLWLQLNEGASGEAVLKSMSTLGMTTTKEKDVDQIIKKEQAQMERVGVFGTLSIGFLAATIMATLGLLIYSYASLQDRLYRFSVLRAIGLMRSQIVGQVVLEYTFLTAYGSTVGALVGILASELFIPFFRVTGDEGIPLPPLIPVIVQDGIGSLAVTFAIFIIVMEMIVIVSALYSRLFGLLKGHWS